MQRTLVIGDIHGCYVELLHLLDKVGVGADWHIISLGDMVDRGPDSAYVVHFFKTGQGQYNAAAIRGNHENKHIRIVDGEHRLYGDAQVTTLCSYYDAKIQDTYVDHIEWFRTLPLYMELDQCYLTHGYVEPNVPFDQQKPQVLMGTMGGWNYMQKRYVGEQWYDLYNFDKPVIVGHTDLPDVIVHPNKVWQIDTGCVFGNMLTGIVLPEWRIVQVPAFQKYWISTGAIGSEKGYAI